MALKFEWDPNKDRSNLAKHGISFKEASSVFGDVASLTISDPEHAALEDRFVTIGYSDRNKLRVVVHTDRGDSIRVISARGASKRERSIYEEKRR